MIENRQTFIERLKRHSASSFDVDMIMLAYDVSKEAHRTRTRDSGERYFEHPRALVIIALDELGWYDRDVICALFLHDAGEDSPIFGNRTAGWDSFVSTATYRISRMFNENVAEIVIALTKPEVDGIRFFVKKETGEYYLSNIMKEEKVLRCKAIDRLHNLRTSGSDTLAVIKKSKRTLEETKEVYLPLFRKINGVDGVKEKLLHKITTECKRLEIETVGDSEKRLQQEDDQKWKEIQELCDC